MYFSALKEFASEHELAKVQPVTPGERYLVGARSYVFAHDIMRGLPPEYEQCDVIYTDLAWKRGLPNFNRMAGAQTDFDAYMRKVLDVIAGIKIPAFIICGKESYNYMKNAPVIFQVQLNGSPALCYAFNTNTMVGGVDTVELLHRLAETYNCVGDFCCGFGRAGRIFMEHGKDFIMSDINARAVRVFLDSVAGVSV